VPESVPAVTKTAEPAAAPAVTSKSSELPATSTVTVNLEEQIRFRAFELYLQRNGQSENADEDWYRAVVEISAKYEAAGYQVYIASGYWWARKQLLSTDY
jgi:hypothetical protein